MSRYLKKILHGLSSIMKNSFSESSASGGIRQPVSKCLADNLTILKKWFGESNDFVVREFIIPVEKRQAAVIFIDGLVNQAFINDNLLKPLMVDSLLVHPPERVELNTAQEIMNAFLLSGEAKAVRFLQEAAEACLNGDAVLMVSGLEEALFFNAKGWEKRSISEPQTETVVRGPREGFTETLRTNTSLLRRRLKTSDLRLDLLQIGRRTNTQICVAYIEGIANPAIVQEVKDRLSTINTDAIINSGYIEEYIEDAPFSVFPTIGYTEKPDVAAAKLLEGRVALIIDGTPFVLTIPLLFIENFQTSEDYASRMFYASFLRLLRLGTFFISLFGPGTYIVLTMFHQELIPKALLFTMAAASEGLPFSPSVEAAIMLLTFEILREAGIRLPKPIGQAISIVGALVMGQAAVQAGLVSAPVVILIAFTAVASFVSPNIMEATVLMRWYILFLSAFMGGLGLTLGAITILIHLASLKSFSTLYLHPLAPLYPADLRDSFYRGPLWQLRSRPVAFNPLDLQRQQMQMPRFSQDDPAKNTSDQRRKT